MSNLLLAIFDPPPRGLTFVLLFALLVPGCRDRETIVILEPRDQDGDEDAGASAGEHAAPPSGDRDGQTAPPSDAGPQAAVPFTLESPSVVVVSPGESRHTWVALQREEGFREPVELSFEGLPSGIYASKQVLEGGLSDGGLVVSGAARLPVAARIPVTLVASSRMGTRTLPVTVVVQGASLTPDVALAEDAFTLPDVGISNLLPQEDGRILVVGVKSVGFTLDPDRFVMARFEHSGELDGTFGDGGLLEPALPNTLAIDSARLLDNGKVVTLSRNFSCAGSSCELSLSRFELDGTLDATFGSGGFVTLSQGAHRVANPSFMTELEDGRLAVAVPQWSEDTGDQWSFWLVDVHGAILPFKDREGPAVLRPPAGTTRPALQVLIPSNFLSILAVGAIFEWADGRMGYGLAEIGPGGSAAWSSTEQLESGQRISGMWARSREEFNVLVSTGAPLYRPSFRQHYSLIINSGGPVEQDWLDAMDPGTESTYYEAFEDAQGGFIVNHTVDGHPVLFRLASDGRIDRSLSQEGFVRLPTDMRLRAGMVSTEPVGGTLIYDSHTQRWVRLWQ